VPVREGLARLEGVESISETCDRKAGTGELRLRHGRLVDPVTLGQQIRDIRVGARLRALEATIDGTLDHVNGKAHLRIPGAKQSVPLAPLTQKVQMDAINKKPLPLSVREKEAFSVLTARWNGEATPVRIIGPLRKPENSSGITLEVREFVFKTPH
jgi:hypothetical protein